MILKISTQILRRAVYASALIASLCLIAVSPTQRAFAQSTPTPFPICRNLPTPTPGPGPTVTNTPLPTVAPATPGTLTPSPTIPPTPTVNPNAGYLGVGAEQVEKCGARILEVKQDGPADKARLQAGDVIVAIAGKPITGVAELRDAVRLAQAGDKLDLIYQRGVTQVAVTVTLATIPQNTTATLAPTQDATPRR